METLKATLQLLIVTVDLAFNFYGVSMQPKNLGL